MREKYGSENIQKGENARSRAIVISGKEVDEVGFDVISRKQSTWSNLSIISLDGLRIDSLYHQSSCPQQDNGEEIRILSLGLKWTELDLSRNLIADWSEITKICKHLTDLRVLKLK